MYDKKIPFVSLTDARNKRVQFKKIEVAHLKKNVADFEKTSAAEIFLFFCPDDDTIANIFDNDDDNDDDDTTRKLLGVLENDADGKCYKYSTDSKFLLVSKPLFSDKEDFENWEKADEKVEIVGSLAHITKHNMLYIVPLAQKAPPSVDSFNTNSVLVLTKIQDSNDKPYNIYNFIIHSDDVEFSIMFNCDIDHRITMLLQEKVYNKVFWDTFFYFISLLDHEDITLNISKLKVGDEEGVMQALRASYWKYEDDRNQENVKMITHTQEKNFDTNKKLVLLKIILSRIQIKPAIHFSSKYMRHSMRHVIAM
jgi:hypothetical protein